MPARYFNVDPIVTGLGYGFTEMMRGRADRQAIQDAETARRKARQRRLAFGLGGAALGGIGGLALAPAAVASAAGGSGIAAGTALTAAGTPWVTGALTAGLTGAAVGAQAGQMFSEGDVAGGLGAIAAPFIRQQARQEGLADYTAKEGIHLANALTLDKARTAGNIEQMRSDPRNAYLIAEQERNAAIQGYQESVSGGPQAGDIIGNYGPVEGPEGMQPIRAGGPESLGFGPAAMGGEMGPPSPSSPPNIPGPSDVPGMEYRWGVGDYQELSKLQQRRRETVDNPAWVSAHSAEQQAAEWQALARKRQSITPSLVPSEPKPMIPGPDGQLVPAHLGWNPAPDGGAILFDGKDLKHVAPPKGDTDAKTPWEQAPDVQSMETAKAADFKAKTHIDERGRTWKYDPKNRDWEIVKEDSGVDGGKRAKLVEHYQEKFSTENLEGERTLPSDETVMKAVDQHDQLEDKIKLQDDLEEAAKLPAMQLSPEAVAELVSEAVRLYGRDATKYPPKVNEALKMIDARLNPTGVEGLIRGPR